MKKRIVLLGLLVALVLPAFAQRDTVRSNKNEFSIGYGHLQRENRPDCRQEPKPLADIGAISVDSLQGNGKQMYIDKCGGSRFLHLVKPTSRRPIILAN